MITENKSTQTNGSIAKGAEPQKTSGISYRGFVSIDQEMEHVLLGLGKNNASGFKNRYYGKGSI